MPWKLQDIYCNIDQKSVCTGVVATYVISAEIYATDSVLCVAGIEIKLYDIDNRPFWKLESLTLCLLMFTAARDLHAFNPALCELFGHFIVKSKFIVDLFF
jgi:hypothetical protein